MDDFWGYVWIAIIVWGVSSLFGGHSQIDDCRKLVEIANSRIKNLNTDVINAQNSQGNYDDMLDAIYNIRTESLVTNDSDYGNKNKCLKK